MSTQILATRKIEPVEAPPVLVKPQRVLQKLLHPTPEQPIEQATTAPRCAIPATLVLLLTVTFCTIAYFKLPNKEVALAGTTEPSFSGIIITEDEEFDENTNSSIKGTSITSDEKFTGKLETLVEIDTTPPDFDYTEDFASTTILSDFEFSAPQITLEPITISQPEDPKPAVIRPSNKIQPFGELDWENDLFTAIQRIQKLEGIDNINLLWQGNSTNVTAMENPTELLDSFSSRNRRNLGFGAGSRGGYSSTPQLVPGINKNVMASPITITAKPIIIASGAFELRVVFRSEPGYILKDPAKTLAQAKQIFGNDTSFYYPLQVDSVTLKLFEATNVSKITPSVNRQIAENLHTLLMKKYSALYQRTSNTGNDTWYDKTGHKITLTGKRNWNSLTQLHYSNIKSRHQQNLAFLQKRLQEEAHQNKFLGKQSLQKSL
jgi:hypothetical protein